jgi:adenylosuccinate lyase
MEKNLNKTKGLVYSQRVMLALIDKGLGRQEAYKMVQRNAMKSWEGEKDFLKLLEKDAEVTAVLPPAELEPLFDYKYYLRYVDEIFKRLGLTDSQWKKKYMALEPKQLGPRSI